MALLDKVSSGLTKVLPKLQSDREVAQFTRENIQPIPPEVADETLNKPLSMLDPPAIDFRLESQLALLSSFRSQAHQALFRELREDQVINRFGFGSEGVSNTFCNTPDAEIYAAMIMDRRPPRVVEVGSGFSTLVAQEGGVVGHVPDTKIVVYDPFPRTDVKPAADELNLMPVERSDLAQSDWSSRDLLFIDSSHICRTRGDLPYLFCKVHSGFAGRRAGPRARHLSAVRLSQPVRPVVSHRAVSAGMHALAFAPLSRRHDHPLVVAHPACRDECGLRAAGGYCRLGTASLRLLLLVRSAQRLRPRHRSRGAAYAGFSR